MGIEPNQHRRFLCEGFGDLHAARQLARRRSLAAANIRQARISSRSAHCNGRMGWPERGLYFFFEDGEQRTTSGRGLRVVRVGTHAVTEKSDTSLWDRLKQHQGHIAGSFAGGGNHRGSVFRKHVGRAIIRRDDAHLPTWGVGSKASRAIRQAEHVLESRVSEHIRSMPFLWLDVSDGTHEGRRLRGYLESNSIAVLSNAGKLGTAEAIDPPSATWLGTFCSKRGVVASGL